MNAKRQTIWLVSMLSLMVVLSAYYLFTEDVNTMNVAADTQAPKEIKIDASDIAAMKNDPKNGTTGAKAADAKTGDAKDAKAADAKTGDAKDAKAADAKTGDAKDAKAADSKAAAGANAKDSADNPADAKAADAKASAAAGKDAKSAGTAKDAKSAAQSGASGDSALTDSQVMKKIQAQATAKSGSDYFIDQQMKRSEAMSKKMSELLTIITDKNKTQDEVTKAHEELYKLQDKDDKISNLEQVLMKDYPQVFITEDSNKWKVTVESNSLQKSQAVSIVDQVIKEMNVGPEKVVVQYLP